MSVISCNYVSSVACGVCGGEGWLITAALCIHLINIRHIALPNENPRSETTQMLFRCETHRIITAAGTHLLLMVTLPVAPIYAVEASAPN